MLQTKRADEISSQITAFDQPTYPKKEFLKELHSLQNQTVDYVLGKSDEDKKRKMFDVINYFKKRNELLGNPADEELRAFMRQCERFREILGKESSGVRGEREVSKTFSAYKRYNKILQNIEFQYGDKKTEIDSIFITSKAIFIIETKNIMSNVSISPEGILYPTGKTVTGLCNLKEKMDLREQIITEILHNAGIFNTNIEKIVVFANEKSKVEFNGCKDFHICMAGDLPRLIYGYRSHDLYSEDRIDRIAEVLNEEGSKIEFKLCKYDAASFKRSLTTLMNKLDDAENPKLPEEPKKTNNIRHIIKIASPIAASLAICVASAGLLFFKSK